MQFEITMIAFQHVVMLDKRGGPISGMPNWSSGFMPATFQGTLFRPTGSPILDLNGPEDFSGIPQRNQLDFLEDLIVLFKIKKDSKELADRIQETTELAYRMQSETPEAVDLSKESDHTLKAYGIGEKMTDEFGKNCLVARRLVEREFDLYNYIQEEGILRKLGCSRVNREKSWPTWFGS